VVPKLKSITPGTIRFNSTRQIMAWIHEGEYYPFFDSPDEEDLAKGIVATPIPDFHFLAIVGRDELDDENSEADRKLLHESIELQINWFDLQCEIVDLNIRSLEARIEMDKLEVRYPQEDF